VTGQRAILRPARAKWMMTSSADRIRPPLMSMETTVPSPPPAPLKTSVNSGEFHRKCADHPPRKPRAAGRHSYGHRTIAAQHGVRDSRRRR